VTAAPETLRPGFTRLWPSTPRAILEAMTVLILFLVLVGLGVRYAAAASGTAKESSASSQVAALAPALEAYYLDHETYAGMTPQALGLVSEGSTPPALRISNLSAAGFCVQVQVGDWYAAQSGPHAQIRTAQEPLCP
jgi:type II secretory pathway pseudopilin PulG